MQTKINENAKGITTREFNEVFKRFAAKAEALQQGAPTAFAGGARFLMDNAKFHKEVLNSEENRCILIPPLSPEFNKPVEHMFHTIKTEFWKRYNRILLTEGNAVRYIPFGTAKDILTAVVYDVTRPESISKDVSTLRKTFQAVVDAKGGRIASRLC